VSKAALQLRVFCSLCRSTVALT